MKESRHWKIKSLSQGHTAVKLETLVHKPKDLTPEYTLLTFIL